MSYLKSVMIAGIIFLGLDFIWLGYVGKQLYISQMGDLLRLNQGVIEPNYIAMALVYMVLIMGILVFVIPKAQGNPWAAFGWGALFGLVCYGSYDFTNLAVLANWPIWLSVIDLLWGMLVCGITSSVVTWLK